MYLRHCHSLTLVVLIALSSAAEAGMGLQRQSRSRGRDDGMRLDCPRSGRRSEDAQSEEKSKWRLYASPGISLGYTSLQREGGFLLGVELSHYLASEDYLLWFGCLVDWQYDHGSGMARSAIGLEAGLLIFGIDISYLAFLDEGLWADGFRVRGILTLGLMAACLGVGVVERQDIWHPVAELVLLLKYPFRPRTGKFLWIEIDEGIQLNL